MTVSRYSCQTTWSETGSLTTAPRMPAATSPDRRVPVVRGGDDVEALARLHLVAELRNRQRLLRQDRDQRILHIRGHPSELFDAGDPALGHRLQHRTLHQRRPGRTVGEQPCIVPAV